MIDFVILAILIVGVLVALVVRWLTRPRPRCPECGSRQVGIVAKEPLGMRDSYIHTAGEGGGYAAVQVAYQVTSRCNECRAQWTKTITETT